MGSPIMQRRVRLHVPQHVCDAGKFGRGGVGPEADAPAECREVQATSSKCDVAMSPPAESFNLVARWI